MLYEHSSTTRLTVTSILSSSIVYEPLSAPRTQQCKNNKYLQTKNIFRSTYEKIKCLDHHKILVVSSPKQGIGLLNILLESVGSHSGFARTALVTKLPTTGRKEDSLYGHELLYLECLRIFHH